MFSLASERLVGLGQIITGQHSVKELRGIGIQCGERVAVLAPNTHLLLEAHYGIPMAGAVLVALNMRLTADDLAGLPLPERLFE